VLGDAMENQRRDIYHKWSALSRPVTGTRDCMMNPLLLAAAVIVLIALINFAWLYRARSARRWRLALDGYAEREIARDRLRKAPAA
jgi:hypothetical protein